MTQTHSGPTLYADPGARVMDAPEALRLESPPVDQLPATTRPAALQGVSLLPVEEMQGALAEYESRRNAFRRWLLEQFREGVHYGVPPGCDPRNADSARWINRPSLYKAGAEMLCSLLMMQARWEVDIEAWKQLGSKPEKFVLRCELVNLGSPFFPAHAKGDVLGEGRGVFCVGEKKMQENAALKMCEKRALVDAAINTLGLSDLFTQDLEDLQPEPSPRPDADPAAPHAPTRMERKQAPAAAAAPSTDRAGEVSRRWQARNPEGDKPAFIAWAKAQLRLPEGAKLVLDGKALADLEIVLDEIDANDQSGGVR